MSQLIIMIFLRNVPWLQQRCLGWTMLLWVNLSIYFNLFRGKSDENLLLKINSISNDFFSMNWFYGTVYYRLAEQWTITLFHLRTQNQLSKLLQYIIYILYIDHMLLIIWYDPYYMGHRQSIINANKAVW